MKSLNKLILVFTLVCGALNTIKAQQSLQDDKASKADEVKGLIQSENYVFEATVDPKKGNDSLKYHKYAVAISKDTLIANLPPYASGDSIKFTCTNFKYEATKGKDGHWDISIKPNTAISNVKQLLINVAPTGRASLRVLSPGHNPLLFEGYIKQEDY